VPEKRINVISVDLEDWYTSAYLRDYVSEKQCVPAIHEATLPILELFRQENINATFFVLGSIAEKHPSLIKKIADSGHEIASHGFSHTPLWKQTPASFKNEIRKTNGVLENITGKKVKGYRAPYASLDLSTAWAINILEDEGFVYDSSIFPMRTPLYGVKNAPVSEYKISSKNILQHNPSAKIIEIPFSIYQFGFLKIPCTGGIYGRMLPYFILKLLLSKIEKNRPINFYFHPWETYRGIPRINVPFYNRLVSYYNIETYLEKIAKATRQFNFCSFEQYFKIND